MTPYPLQELTLRLFASHLARTVSYATIQTYLAAVRHRHIELGFPPCFAQMHLLRLLLRGIKRVKGSSCRPKRIPITLDRMKQLKEYIRAAAFSPKDKLMVWAACTTAFFGFLRSSEFCSSSTTSFDPQTTLLVKDLAISSGIVSLHIKASKSDPFRDGHDIHLAPSHTSVCPVRALQTHLPNCASKDKPLFTFSDGTYLTRSTITGILRQCFSQGASSQNISSHSFRIGAATTAAAANIPDWLIKVLGRWSSNCFERYIRTPSNVLNRVPKILAKTAVPASMVWSPY